MSEVCIKIFEDRDEAELFRTFLEDQGIDSYILEEECCECSAHMSECEGVKLIVDESDKLEALKIIEEALEENEEDEY